MKAALIVAGGRGTRMGGTVPKQFVLFRGWPVMMHSIQAFRDADPQMAIVVVLPGDLREEWVRLCAQYSFASPDLIAPAGETRFESVLNGLALFAEDALWIAVHDAVRPMISRDTILRLFEEAKIHGCAVPSIAPGDSVRWSDDRGNRIIDRNRIRLIQTPQVFELNKLRQAYVLPYDPSFTDDASVWEAAGYKVHLTEGQRDNIKITWPEDLPSPPGPLSWEERGEVLSEH